VAGDECAVDEVVDRRGVEGGISGVRHLVLTDQSLGIGFGEGGGDALGDLVTDVAVLQQRVGDPLGPTRVEHGVGHDECRPGQGPDPQTDAQQGGGETAAH
jgi:hypothetical protein